jgi:hypothetical protein
MSGSFSSFVLAYMSPPRFERTQSHDYSRCEFHVKEINGTICLSNSHIKTVRFLHRREIAIHSASSG